VFNPAERGATDLSSFLPLTSTMAQGEVNNVTVSQGVRMLFSLMTPNESSFATVQEVPKYVNQVSLTSLLKKCEIRAMLHNNNNTHRESSTEFTQQSLNN